METNNNIIQEGSLRDSQILSEDSCSPEKIPDKILLKLARKEIGELNSYIDELEYRLQKIEEELREKEKMTPKEEREIKIDVFYKEINKKINEKNIIIRDLKKENERLLYTKLSNCRECLLKKQNNS